MCDPASGQLEILAPATAKLLSKLPKALALKAAKRHIQPRAQRRIRHHLALEAECSPALALEEALQQALARQVFDPEAHHRGAFYKAGHWQTPNDEIQRGLSRDWLQSAPELGADQAPLVLPPRSLREASLALPLLRALTAHFESPLTLIGPSPLRDFWDEHLAQTRWIEPLQEAPTQPMLLLERPDDAERLPDPAHTWTLPEFADLGQCPPSPRGPARHRVAEYLDLGKALGVAVGQAEFFPAPRAATAAASTPILAAPLSDFGEAFQWPNEAWQEWAQHEPQEIRWIALPEHSEALQHWCDAQGFTASPAHDLKALIAQLDQAEHLVSVDSSLPHLATHRGLTCEVHFGPGSPQRFRPLGKHHQIHFRKVPCNPCFLEKCPLDHRCTQSGLTTFKQVSIKAQ